MYRAIGSTLPEELRPLLQSGLREADDVVVLPGAHYSREDLQFHNTVFDLDGDGDGVPICKFSDEWGTKDLSATRLSPRSHT